MKNAAITLAVALGLALSFTYSSTARAGDDAAHHQAGTDGMDKVVLNNPSSFFFCQSDFVTRSAIGPTCPFHAQSTWGDAVRGPDEWPCWLSGPVNEVSSYRTIPPMMNQMNWDIGGTALRASSLSCNWTHFAKNLAVDWKGSDPNTDWAQSVTETWTDDILTHIQKDADTRNYYKEYCDAPTFEMFTKRALNAVHFAHDKACQHHTNGNNICSPAAAFGGWRTGCSSFLKKAEASIFYGPWQPVGSCNLATCPPAPLRCDAQLRSGPVLYQNKKTAPTSVRLQYGNPAAAANTAAQRACLKAGSAIACSGYERTVRHHCELNWVGRDYVGLDADPLYGECGVSNFSSTNGAYPTVGANLVNDIVGKHLKSWQQVCAPPLTPCDPDACWTWCDRSTPPPDPEDVPPGQDPPPVTVTPFGACTTEPKDDQTCKPTTCTCQNSQKDQMFADVCGGAGEPACPKQTAKPPCESGLQTNPSTGRCEACGKSGQVCCASDTCTDGTACAAAEGSCVKTCGASTCKQTMCQQSVLQQWAWCPELCMCVSACLCTQPDPESNGCLSWSDEWAVGGCKGPNPVMCF